MCMHAFLTIADRFGVSWLSCIGLFTSDMIQLMFLLSNLWLRAKRDPSYRRTQQLQRSLNFRQLDVCTGLQPRPKACDFIP